MSDLKMVVGLGNPGPKYARHRHNVGFQIVETLARRHNIEMTRTRNRARIGDGWVSRRRGSSPLAILGGSMEREKVLLVRPLTYMNGSGESVGPLAAYFDIDVDSILVIYDDLDLESGTLRLRPGGGAGGQKGMKSIIQHLGSQDFPRIRVGIGRPPGRLSASDYVLQNFSETEEESFGPLRETAADAAESWLFDGIDAAMNQYNG